MSAPPAGREGPLRRLLSTLASHAGPLTWVAALGSVLSGLATTALLAGVGRQLAAGAALEADAAPRTWRFAVAAGVVLLSKLASEQLVYRASLGAAFQLRMRLVRSLLAAPLRQLELAGSTRLEAAMTEDVKAVALALPLVSSAIVDSVLLLGGVAYVGVLSVRLLAALCLLLAGGAASYALLLRRAGTSFRQALGARDGVFEALGALAEGHKQLQLDGARRARFSAGLGEELVALRAHNRRAQALHALAQTCGALLLLAAVGLTLFLPQLGGALDAAVRAEATAVLLYLTLPLGNLAHALPAMGAASEALSRIEALGLSLRPEPGAAVRGPAPGNWSKLELREVRAGYGREGEPAFALGPISLELRRGELVFLTGGNGSGKSTLLKVLTGLYTPVAGQVLLDGRPVTDASRDAYRQLFSVVFADHQRFGTLAGIDAPGWQARAHQYLAEFQLAAEVSLDGAALDAGRLSTGQGKRLDLLSALVEGRPICVFDEVAAEQDPAFKRAFYRELLPALRASGRTVVVISHDDRFFDVADRLLKLEDGRLAPPP